MVHAACCGTGQLPSMRSKREVMQELVTFQREQAFKTCGHCFVLQNWKLWLSVAIVAIIGVTIFNWAWLVAAGLAPILLATLPCLAMCALSLCARHGQPTETTS